MSIKVGNSFVDIENRTLNTPIPAEVNWVCQDKNGEFWGYVLKPYTKKPTPNLDDSAKALRIMANVGG